MHQREVKRSPKMKEALHRHLPKEDVKISHHFWENNGQLFSENTNPDHYERNLLSLLQSILQNGFECWQR